MDAPIPGERKKRGLLKGILILFALILVFAVMVNLLPFGGNGDFSISKSGDKIGVVEVFGVITGSADITRQIKKYADDKSIKGILVHIDSPGGVVAPSQEIYSALVEARKKKKVVASMASLAASGGYYIAVGADKVMANPGTITGSIGVIIGFMDMHSVMEKLGVKSITVKSGKFKDIGASSREFTEDDRKVLQSVIDDVYEQFVEAVATERHMTIEEVKKLADGRIYSGRQSKELGLIDRLGGFSDAVKLLGELAGISGEPVLVREKEKYSFIKELFSNRLGGLWDRYKVTSAPGLYYLWTL